MKTRTNFKFWVFGIAYNFNDKVSFNSLYDELAKLYFNKFRNKPNYSTTLSIKIVSKSIAACAIFVPGPKIPTAPASNKY